MINIVLYDNNATLRIASNAIRYFSYDSSLHTNQDTIWINGMYIRFQPRLITINIHNKHLFTPQNICDFLKSILIDEEICISSSKCGPQYINSVTMTTAFDNIRC